MRFAVLSMPSPDEAPKTPTSNRAWSAQQSHRQEENRSYQRQHALHGDADDAERQEQQPNKGIKHEREQRQRPAEEEQQAPEQESEHGHHSLHLLLRTSAARSSVCDKGI